LFAEEMMMKSRKNNRKQPRRNALVRTVPIPGEKRAPFRKNATLVFLGEIPNMPGHCIVADLKTGTLSGGYHTERFEEIPDDET
jgi:hypothetical protein